MINYVSVFIGGGLGCVLRFVVNNVCTRHYAEKLFYATFVSNIIGCFLLGIFLELFFLKQEINPALKYAVTIGFCGGLTTFSTFSFELFEMFEKGQIFNASLYIIASLVFSIFALWGGYSLAKLF